MWPSYLGLDPADLRRRAAEAVQGLQRCVACPRACTVDRTQPRPRPGTRIRGRQPVCRTWRHAVVASSFPHRGEEDCLRGTRGSGTIFFAGCNLRCVFCQNWDTSQDVRGQEETAEEIGARMLALQRAGCHNVNLVTPEHVVPQVLEALAWAIPRGLALPIVYNTSAYDALESLRLLDGIVDIYMPDLKLLGRDLARRYLKAPDYPEVARAAIREMHRQVGPLEIDPRTGLARRGVLVRHLVMPGLPDETREILRFLAEEISPETYVNVMGQYRPAHLAARYPEIDRPLRVRELAAAFRAAEEEGLSRLDGRWRPAR